MADPVGVATFRLASRRPVTNRLNVIEMQTELAFLHDIGAVMPLA